MRILCSIELTVMVSCISCHFNNKLLHHVSVLYNVHKITLENMKFLHISNSCAAIQIQRNNVVAIKCKHPKNAQLSTLQPSKITRNM